LPVGIKCLNSVVMCLSVACEKAAGRCQMAAAPADLTVIEEVITIERASCLFISQFYRVAFLLIYLLISFPLFFSFSIFSIFFLVFFCILLLYYVSILFLFFFYEIQNQLILFKVRYFRV